MPLDFHLLDVFADVPFGGNPLAVFPDARGLDEGQMQRIAGELNLSETAFVLPPTASDAICRLRIFTPRIELPFAGHPTIGTACLLATLGTIPIDDEDAQVTFEEAVGPIAIRLRRGPDRSLFVQLTAGQAPETRAHGLSRDNLASLLGLAPDDIGFADEGDAAAISVGVPFLLVPVRTSAALARVRFDIARWRMHLADAWAPHVVAFCRDASDGADVRLRMFSPPMGITEDPATGAAAAALAAYLARRTPDSSGTYRWMLRQGIEIGRPSRLHIEAEKMAETITAIRVGGTAVIIGRGQLLAPPGAPGRIASDHDQVDRSRTRHP